MDRECHLGSGESSLEALCKQLVKREKEIAAKEKLYGSIRDVERELDIVKMSISEGKEKLGLLENNIQRKSQEHREMMTKYDDVAELKERRLNEIQKSFEELAKEFESKQERLEEREKEIRANKEALRSIKSSMAKCSGELRLKEKRLALVKRLNERYSETWKKTMDDHAQEFEMKERRFEGLLKDLELKEDLFGSRIEELELIEKNVKECLEELELKEKDVVLLRSSVEERFGELVRRECELEKRTNEFEMKQREIEASGCRSANLEEVEKVDLEQENTSSDSHQYCNTKEKKDLQWLLNELLKRYDLVCNEIGTVLRAPLDATMLALRSIQRKNPSDSHSEDVEFDASLVRRTSVILSELITKAPANISPRVREEALKFARAWKVKMTVQSENGLEVWAFLQFLVGYRLASEFDENELRRLLEVVGLNSRASHSQPSICSVDKEDFIEKLIKRGEIVHAVRHVCALKLTDKFSPVQLLTDLSDHAQSYTKLICKGKRSNEEKKKAAMKEVWVLEAVLECVQECGLERGFPSDKHSKRIFDLKTKALFSYSETGPSKKQGKDAFAPPQDDQPQQGKAKTPRTTKIELEACRSSSRVSVSPPQVWEKPPRGVTKLNFGFWGQEKCGFASVVARSDDGTVHAILYCKTPSSDPLTGNALASHGALKLAISSGYRAVHLEGDSVELIDILRGKSAAPASVSGVVSESVGLLKSFKYFSLCWVRPEANMLAENVCRWASGNNIEDDISWVRMPGTLVSIFDSMQQKFRV